jgi:hypothetical protein
VGASGHPLRLLVNGEDGLLLGQLVGLELAQGDDGPQGFGVVAPALGFGEDFLLLLGNILLLGLQLPDGPDGPRKDRRDKLDGEGGWNARKPGRSPRQGRPAQRAHGRSFLEQVKSGQRPAGWA